MARISRVVSGGQTGVDRAALEWALAAGVPYGGWCPKGGWAEDFPDPPGLLAVYPDLTETPSADPAQRTAWNVRDSDATIMIRTSSSASPGTDFTVDEACRQGKPLLELDPERSDSQDRLIAFIDGLGAGRSVNIAGPRESESPGIGERARALLDRLGPG